MHTPEVMDLVNLLNPETVCIALVKVETTGKLEKAWAWLAISGLVNDHSRKYGSENDSRISD